MVHHIYYINNLANYRYCNTYVTISNRVSDVWIRLNKLLAHCFIFIWNWIQSVLDHTSSKSSNDLTMSCLSQHTTSYGLLGAVGVFVWNIK